MLAIEAHIGIGISPWIEGAHVAPAKVVEKPRRHTKPSGDGAGPWATLIAGKGLVDGLEVADLVHTVCDAAGVDGEQVRDVRVLQRFSLLTVPAGEAERISDALKDRLEVELARN